MLSTALQVPHQPQAVSRLNSEWQSVLQLRRYLPFGHTSCAFPYHSCSWPGSKVNKACGAQSWEKISRKSLEVQLSHIVPHYSCLMCLTTGKRYWWASYEEIHPFWIYSGQNWFTSPLLHLVIVNLLLHLPCLCWVALCNSSMILSLFFPICKNGGGNVGMCPCYSVWTTTEILPGWHLCKETRREDESGEKYGENVERRTN